MGNSSAVGDPKSFPTERALAGKGFLAHNRLLEANQVLCQRGIALKAEATVSKYIDDEQAIGKLHELVVRNRQHDMGVISISESWTDEALLFLCRAKNRAKMAAMVFANCSFLGGNYSDGGYVRAQEEALCRQFPALFESMKTPKTGATMDPRGMWRYSNHIFGPRFEDGYSVARNVLFIDQVQCLRAPEAGSFRLLRDEKNRISSSFVLAAAPLFGRGRDRSFTMWEEEPHNWYEKTILNVFLAPKASDINHDVIVVGPWGCGAFGNDPALVVDSFINVIKKHNLLRLYKEIHFCLGRRQAVDRTIGGKCSSNVDVFRSKLTAAFESQVQDYSEDLNIQCRRWLAGEASNKDADDAEAATGRTGIRESSRTNRLLNSALNSTPN